MWSSHTKLPVLNGALDHRNICFDKQSKHITSSQYSIKACEKLYNKNQITRGYDDNQSTNQNSSRYQVVDCKKSITKSDSSIGRCVEMSHFWPCGQWTCANEVLDIDNNINDSYSNKSIISNCKYNFTIGNFFLNKHKPQLSIVSPKSVDNSLLLSKLCVTRYF